MNTSIIGRAMAKGLLTLTTLNIREYSVRGDGRIDDYPYGGGAGMVMQAEPVCRTYESLSEQLGYRPRLIYLTPQGRVFNQQMAKEFAQEKDLVFLCGHYEGIDERVLEEIATDLRLDRRLRADRRRTAVDGNDGFHFAYGTWRSFQSGIR